MRRTEKIDLATVDIASLPLPSTGEKLIYDSEALGLALRLRTSGSRTWIVFESGKGKTRRKTLGDAFSLPVQSARAFCSAPLPTPQKGNSGLYSETASVAEVMAGYLAFGENRRWKPSTGRRQRRTGAPQAYLKRSGREEPASAGGEISRRRWFGRRACCSRSLPLEPMASGSFKREANCISMAPDLRCHIQEKRCIVRASIGRSYDRRIRSQIHPT